MGRPMNKAVMIEKLKALEKKVGKDVDQSLSTRELSAWQLDTIESFLDRHKYAESQWDKQQPYYQEMIRTLNTGRQINWNELSARILADDPELIYIR